MMRMDDNGLLGVLMLFASRPGDSSCGSLVFIALALLSFVFNGRGGKTVRRRLSELFATNRYHVRTITHKKTSNFFGWQEDEGYNNALLQKAISFAVNRSDASWDKCDLDLTITDDTCKDRFENVVDKYTIVRLPPVGTWVRVAGVGGAVVEFMRDKWDRETSDGKKSMESHVMTLRAHASTRYEAKKAVDGFIQDAVDSYKSIIDQKKDPNRYMYVPYRNYSNDHESEVIMYKRYYLADKPFDSFYHPKKDSFLQLLDSFQNKTDRFALPHYPNKLGFLLYGPPGTGKTSFIKSVATYTNRHIVSISLEKIHTNQELLGILYDRVYEVNGRDVSFAPRFNEIVFVIEDIDAMGNIVEKRNKASIEPDQPLGAVDGKTAPVTKFIKNKKDDDRLNLAGLLNALDGVLDSPDRIIIMTTNHPDKLDPALVRPGRVNIKVHMDYMSGDNAAQMLKSYFGPDSPEETEQRIRDVFSYKNITPACLEAVCAQFDTLERALENLEQSSDEFYP